MFTADARLRHRTRIVPVPDGARDATQFDAAISPDGRSVAWVETRINAVFGGSDFRRYVAGVGGQNPRQVAANGGRPFVSWFDASTIVREGPRADVPPLAPDQSLCLPDAASATNGVCGRVIARDPTRHLRHPSVSPNRRPVVATAYAPPGGDDLETDHAGAIVVFDAAAGAILRQLTAGPSDAARSSPPTDGSSRSSGAARSGAYRSRAGALLGRPRGTAGLGPLRRAPAPGPRAGEDHATCRRPSAATTCTAGSATRRSKTSSAATGRACTWRASQPPAPRPPRAPGRARRARQPPMTRSMSERAAASTTSRSSTRA